MSLDWLEITSGLCSAERGERGSRPKSSKLDASLSWLETTEGLRSDGSGVGE